MRAETGTHIALGNLVSDVRRQRLDRLIVGLVLIRVLRMWPHRHRKWRRRRNELSLYAAMIFDSAVQRVGDQALCCGPHVRCRQKVSRIVDGPALWEWLLVKSSRAFALRHGSPHSCPIRAFLPIGPNDIRKGAMLRGGKKPIAWVTKTRELSRVVRDLSDLEIARRVRDFLGLSHYKPDTELYEIIYPVDALKGKKVAAPTVLDGGCEPVYRSSTSRKTWGRALDLATRKSGAQEVVHEPIPFTSNFQVRYLGPVAKTSVRTDPTLARRTRHSAEGGIRHLQACIVLGRKTR